MTAWTPVATHLSGLLFYGTIPSEGLTEAQIAELKAAGVSTAIFLNSRYSLRKKGIPLDTLKDPLKNAGLETKVRPRRVYEIKRKQLRDKNIKLFQLMESKMSKGEAVALLSTPMSRAKAAAERFKLLPRNAQFRTYPIDLPSPIYRSLGFFHRIHESQTDFRSLRCLNITHVAPLVETPFLKDRYAPAGITNIGTPLDVDQLDPKEFRALVKRIAQASREGFRVLIYCRCGLDRTGAVLGALTKHVEKISDEQVIEKLNSLPLRPDETVLNKALDFFNPTKMIQEMRMGFQFTHIPFPEVRGQILRGRMPSSINRDNGALLNAMKELDVGHVVVLCSEQECERSTGTDLAQLYRDHGFTVTEFPIIDFNIPSMEDLQTHVAEIIDALEAGTTVLTHCMGGQGRTGTLLSCVVGQLRELDGPAAIAFLRNYFHAVETPTQEKLVTEFLASNQDSSESSQEPIVSTQQIE